jgi:hypothetical protein
MPAHGLVGHCEDVYPPCHRQRDHPGRCESFAPDSSSFAPCCVFALVGVLAFVSACGRSLAAKPARFHIIPLLLVGCCF